MTNKLVILQRVCAPYRMPFFSKVAKNPDIDLTVIYGEDIPNSKVKSAARVDGFASFKLKTAFLKLGHRILPWHRGLLKQLIAEKPKVILCEAESHFLGYLVAIFYKIFLNRKVKLLYWCYIDLPGKIEKKGSLAYRLKKFTRKFFDGFYLYSSFGVNGLMDQGVDLSNIYVATNVGDVERHLKQADKITMSKSEIRKKLDLEDKYTILYVGTLDANKRPEVMVDLASKIDANFILLGKGPELEKLQSLKKQKNLDNIHLLGHVGGDIPLYYKAANLLLIPGRGGIVISEAMAYGVPVMVHQADGTEVDLIQAGETGRILNSGSAECFEVAIRGLMRDEVLQSEMSIKCRHMIENKYNTSNMVNTLVRAVKGVGE